MVAIHTAANEKHDLMMDLGASDVEEEVVASVSNALSGGGGNDASWGGGGGEGCLAN
jgi:hypothetical protein|tara:strand:- start:708 stop:878 length:171 start_codon:yes stop_codon:yes gene_type:complete